MATVKSGQRQWRCQTGRLLTTGVATAAVLLGAGGVNAHADAEHHVYGTGGEGLWLHSVPSLPDGLLLVLPEGAPFSANCWTEGPDVNGNPIWLYGSSEGRTGNAADFYVDTEWQTTQDLVDQGIGHCGDTPSSEPVAPVAPAAPVEEPTHFDGTLIGDSGSLAYDLYDHYMWEDGEAAVIASSVFSNRTAFMNKVNSIPVGSQSTWSASPGDADLLLALGTFTITRPSEHCWTVYDYYDFESDKVQNAIWYLAFYGYQVSGARNFEVHSSGCS